MRENKFRGFVEAESRWIYGDLLHSYWHLDGVVYETAIRYKINDGYSYPIPVKPDTVGLLTGLYDKDGQEIYDGDIVKYESDIMTVGWDEKFASFVIDKEGWAFRHYFGEAVNPENIKVIGNIHEHPELLNEQK
jgi:uncharacterized phage protein (TIGR01671 family)